MAYYSGITVEPGTTETLSFGTTTTNDGTVVKQGRKPRSAKRGEKFDSVMDLTGISQVQQEQQKNRVGLRSKDAGENTPVILTLGEDKGIIDSERDEYKKYNQQLEPDADQFLINSSATIIDSRIELTDSQGNNRIVVRRNTQPNNVSITW